MIGFLGSHPISKTICLRTGGFPFWPIYAGVSHVGIIGTYKRKNYLFESTELTNLPCVITGQQLAGSQANRLEDRLATYEGHVWHYPLVSPLYSEEKRRLNRFLRDHVGRPYDRLGAFGSADRVGWWVDRLLGYDQLSTLYCSEWVEAAWRQIGRLEVAELGRMSPNRLCRVARRTGIIHRRRRLK